MRTTYETWLRDRYNSENTVLAQIYRSSRVEEYYGDLERHYEIDRLESLLSIFSYTARDGRMDRPNPTLIPYKGAVPGNMSGYKFAIRLYRTFLDSTRSTQDNVIDGSDDDIAIDLTPKPRRSRKPNAQPQPVDNPVTLEHFRFDGFAALQAIVAGSAYGTLAQAIASLTVFSHPDTVSQTGGRSLFKTIRGPRTPGVYDELNGQPVMLDDNKSASDAFKWTHGITRGLKDIQFNHIYTASRDVDSYTSLANICVTPAFLAKLTDDSSPMLSALIKYRAWDLYRWTPGGIEPPNMPIGYEALDWAPPLPPVYNVRKVVEDSMATKPKDRTVLSTIKIGWLFNEKP